MAKGPRYKVKFRRRREGKTDYRYRLRLLKARLPRAVVRKSLNNFSVQFINYSAEGDKVIASAVSGELKKFGWSHGLGNTPAAYLTGLLAGKRALAKNVDKAVLDLGLQTPAKGSRVFAALKGMLDAGIEIPHGEGLFPSEERIKGSHINKELPKKFDEVKAKV